MADLTSILGAEWLDRMDRLKEGPRTRLSFGIPSLDDFVPLFPEENKVVVVALPWQPAGETSFVVAQAFAKQGHNPLCVNPGWSPYWDGALKVDRLEEPPGIDYFGRLKLKVGGGQPVVIDQFSRANWDIAKSHADREDIVSETGKILHSLAWERQSPVVVFTRRRTRDVVRMSGEDLRSDGALGYHADAVLMVDPHPRKDTADLLVVKHRRGPTGAFPGVHWPNLPRTAAYRRPKNLNGDT